MTNSQLREILLEEKQRLEGVVAHLREIVEKYTPTLPNSADLAVLNQMGMTVALEPPPQSPVVPALLSQIETFEGYNLTEIEKSLAVLGDDKEEVTITIASLMGWGLNTDPRFSFVPRA